MSGVTYEQSVTLQPGQDFLGSLLVSPGQRLSSQAGLEAGAPSARPGLYRDEKKSFFWQRPSCNILTCVGTLKCSFPGLSREAMPVQMARSIFHRTDARGISTLLRLTSSWRRSRVAWSRDDM